MIKINGKWYHTKEEKDTISNSCRGMNIGEKNGMKRKEVVMRANSRENMIKRINNGFTTKGKSRPDASERMKLNNPMKNPEIAKRVGLKLRGHSSSRKGKHHTEESIEKMRKFRKNKTYEELYGNEKAFILKKNRKEWIRNNPEKYANQIMAQKGFISKPQKKMFHNIKSIYSDAELEYPIRTMQGMRFADVAIPSLKIVCEYNGSYWHKNKESDELRAREISKVGWKVFMFNEKNVFDVLKILGDVRNESQQC